MTFRGFPADGLAFLAELEANNNKAWFEANRARYEQKLLGPTQAFLTELGERLQSIAPSINYDTRTDGRGTLMRIYRDTRFSRDKSPYKNNLSGLYWEGAGKKTGRPAFGFRVTAEDMGLMVGMHGFPKEMLAAYRQAAADEKLGVELSRIVAEVRKDPAYTVGGAHYKRVPAGFDPDHPRAELLKYNALYAYPPAFSAAQTRKPDLVDRCFQEFERLAPLYHWMVKALGSQT